MENAVKRLLLLTTTLLLVACASGPIKTEQAPADVTVGQARMLLDDSGILTLPEPGPVMWGGIILDTRNLADTTQIEVMGYPLDRRQRPMTGRDAEGRFVVRFAGFLEPVDYAPGRSITVLGSVDSSVAGTVGESDYRYPVLQASDIHLWNVFAPETRTGVYFGVGINISN